MEKKFIFIIGIASCFIGFTLLMHFLNDVKANTENDNNNFEKNIIEDLDLVNDFSATSNIQITNVNGTQEVNIIEDEIEGKNIDIINPEQESQVDSEETLRSKLINYRDGANNLDYNIITVKNDWDDGYLTLREAIKEANETTGPDMILFDIDHRSNPTKKANYTIELKEPISLTDDKIFINACSQPGTQLAQNDMQAKLKITINYKGKGAIFDIKSNENIICGINFEFIDNAISLEENTTYNFIESNIFANHNEKFDKAIYISDSSKFNLIGGFDIEKRNSFINGKNAIKFNISTANIVSNNIFNKLDEAIVFNNTSHDVYENDITDNQFKDNLVGIILDNTQKTINIINNKFNGEFLNAIKFENSEPLILENNIFELEKGNGISFMNLDNNNVNFENLTKKNSFNKIDTNFYQILEGINCTINFQNIENSNYLINYDIKNNIFNNDSEVDLSSESLPLIFLQTFELPIRHINSRGNYRISNEKPILTLHIYKKSDALENNEKIITLQKELELNTEIDLKFIQELFKN